MNDLIDNYLAVWNETDADARRSRIDEVWSADASYVDPMAEAHGRDEIDATVAAVQQMFPGHVFSLIGPVDAHHQQARFTWELAAPGAEPLVVGFDVAVIGADGRIDSVFGFLDKVPAS